MGEAKPGQPNEKYHICMWLRIIFSFNGYFERRKVRGMCSDLVSHLSKVEDPRSDKNKLYPLDEILLLCICAIISGAEDWKDIAEFGRNKSNWLRKSLKFRNGIPSEDCIAWGYGKTLPKSIPKVFCELGAIHHRSH
uniref:DDE_Tnp_1-associated n=1 Tax=Candidatus Kentrum sp. LPFa TaxID=2126335 RepID=A0A450VWY1_9GAMM|nr:MAG: DDE_Tnp_1-associated [Candidatus Kentron sp. LPFa]